MRQARLPARRAIAVGLHSDAFERGERAVQVGALRRFVHPQRAVMAVAVVGDLVTGGGDALDGVGVVVGRVAGDEEGGGQRVLLEQAEDPRDGDLRPVRLVAHQRRVVRVAAPFDQDR